LGKKKKTFRLCKAKGEKGEKATPLGFAKQEGTGDRD
jgi:hypothetical protein